MKLFSGPHGPGLQAGGWQALCRIRRRRAKARRRGQFRGKSFVQVPQQRGEKDPATPERRQRQSSIIECPGFFSARPGMQQVVIKVSDERYAELESVSADVLEPCHTPERWCTEAVESALATQRLPRVARESGGRTEVSQ